MSFANALFPEAYSPWLAKRFPHTVSECFATCHSCAMINPTGVTRDPGPFDPNLKCCTYFPFMPNFGMGAMLRSHGSAGLARMRAAQTQGLLLPLGLFASPEYEAKLASAGPSAFGQRADLLCPFFDSASSACSIWKTRPGVCTTYFCKSERGEQGLAFWADLESYLNHFEWTLANATLWRLGFTEDDTRMCEAVLLTDESGPERDWLSRSVWAEWFERKEELLMRCADEAQKINEKELNELLGEDALALEESLRQRSTLDS